MRTNINMYRNLVLGLASFCPSQTCPKDIKLLRCLADNLSISPPASTDFNSINNMLSASSASNKKVIIKPCHYWMGLKQSMAIDILQVICNISNPKSFLRKRPMNIRQRYLGSIVDAVELQFMRISPLQMNVVDYFIRINYHKDFESISETKIINI